MTLDHAGAPLASGRSFSAVLSRFNARACIPLFLIGAGLLAYHNSFSGAFVFDDLPAIVHNRRIRRLWPPWDVLAQAQGRHLWELSLAVNYRLGGLNVWGYHAVNVAIHILAGLALFGIVRRTLEGERLRARYGLQRTAWPPRWPPSGSCIPCRRRA